MNGHLGSSAVALWHLRHIEALCNVVGMAEDPAGPHLYRIVGTRVHVSCSLLAPVSVAARGMVHCILLI